MPNQQSEASSWMKIVLPIMAGLALQGGVFIFYSGGLSQRVAALEAWKVTQEPMLEKVTRLDERMTGLKEGLNRIETGINEIKDTKDKTK